ncbi:MAG: SMC family ATPase [Nanoarchaeota archaeon]|nr:SMC family ATPase [Nanoarchaeota archaeon]
MLLQQLKLENIRSYTNETINFPSGSTILAGDIGCGKSSILLAIEFALFGTSRPDLPAEMLLRKGSTLGSVELRFRLENQEIVIQRNLKKDRNSIKQLAGHIIINGIKKELMPVELKAEVVNLLGYPEEFITKNKNYIFRYTIYTPQEEMKFILQENIDIRLDVLRKIFNIDKYKTIRDNLQLYLREMRKNIAVLKTRLEPLAEQKEKFLLLLGEKEGLENSLKQLKPLLNEKKVLLQQQKDKLDNLEKEHKIFLELKQREKATANLIVEKEKQLVEVGILPENVIEFPEKIKQMEEQKSEVITKRDTYQQKIDYLQQLIKRTQMEMSVVDLSKIEEKERLKLELELQLKDKEELKQKKLRLDEAFNQTLELISKNKTLLLQAEGIKNQIGSLSNCPTCLQDVCPLHKEKILQTEGEKIVKARDLLLETEQKKKSISEQKEQIQEQIEKILSKENLLIKIRLELVQLQEKRTELEEKRTQLISWVKDNNELMVRLAEVNKINLDQLEVELKKKRKLVDEFNKKQFLEKDLLGLKMEMMETEKELVEKEDLTFKINKEKEYFTILTAEEKELSLEQMKLKTQFEHLVKQGEELTKIITGLNEQQNQLTRLKELYHWLEAHFLKLTYTIEKQVMVNIHNLFNQLFQEWFSILIEDENVYSRLDDSFTPIIEQNGYEISFGHLSGGERTSAALAYRLALNKVINDVVHAIKTKELLILDEPTDGFSSEQLDKVRDVLDRLNIQQTIIVSHESKIESFVENVVRVSKEGHVSKINQT